MGTEKKEVIPFNKKTVANQPQNASYSDINASSRPVEPPMDEDELRVAVARIVVHGTYEESRHSSKDREYRSVSDDDIQACLCGPYKLIGTRLGEDKHRRPSWSYEILGRDLEGNELSLAISVNKETQRICVVTKF